MTSTLATFGSSAAAAGVDDVAGAFVPASSAFLRLDKGWAASAVAEEAVSAV